MAQGTGATIRKRRQVLGWTQQELAAKVGVAKSTVANWEAGNHFPLRYQGKLEGILGISLDGDPAPQYADPALQRIYDAAAPFTERERRMIVEIVATVTSRDPDPEPEEARRSSAG